MQKKRVRCSVDAVGSPVVAVASPAPLPKINSCGRLRLEIQMLYDRIRREL